MRLNMQMIASRLEGWEFQAHLKKGMPRVLHGARMVYAPNCVYMKQEDANVNCTFNEESIILMDIELKYAFEIIQGIFDAYDDWYERVVRHVQVNDWQKVTEETSVMINNPVVFFDMGNRVLGIHPLEPKEAFLDEEWAYLVQHRFSSTRMMRVGRKTIGAEKKGWKFVYREAGNGARYPHMTCNIYKDEASCGFLSVFAFNRDFNDSDCDVLSIVADLVQPTLSLYCNGQIDLGSDCFTALLRGDLVGTKTMELQRRYYNLQAQDHFRLYVISSNPEGHGEDEKLTDFKRALMLNCVVMPIVEVDEHLVVITDLENGSDQGAKTILEEFCQMKEIRFAASLELDALENLYYYYQQALYAHRQLEKGQVSLEFYPLAIDFILSVGDPEKMIYACHPTIRNIVEKQEDREFLLSLETYLRYERSLSMAARQLYVHKNTLLYRIRKLEQKYGLDLDDPYERGYILLSLRILRLFSHHRAE